jgi:hypothetical protein
LAFFYENYLKRMVSPCEQGGSPQSLLSSVDRGIGEKVRCFLLGEYREEKSDKERNLVHTFLGTI